MSTAVTNESQTASDPKDKNLRAIEEMENRGLRERSRGEQISDAIAGLASSPAFALAHVVFFAGWLLSQSGIVPLVAVFDPFPFTFLTLVVSLEAIFLTIFVLISQRRMTRQADRRSHLDLQVNMLAEQESTKSLKVLYAIAQHLQVRDLPPAEALAAETSISDLIEDIHEVAE